MLLQNDVSSRFSRFESASTTTRNGVFQRVTSCRLNRGQKSRVRVNNGMGGNEKNMIRRPDSFKKWETY